MQDKYTKKQDNAKQFKFLFYPIIGFHTHLGGGGGIFRKTVPHGND